MNIKLITLLTLSALTLGACTFDQKAKIQLEGTGDLQSTSSAEAINDTSVDQDSFEKEQEVSSDDSLTTIESEIDSTIILEEDFSDL